MKGKVCELPDKSILGAAAAGDFEGKPVMVYDHDCGFCQTWVRYWQKATETKVAYAPFQIVAKKFPQVPAEEFARAVKLVMPTGQVLSGAHAVFRALSFTLDRGRHFWHWAYHKVPGFGRLSEGLYKFISARRPLFYSLTTFFYGSTPEPPAYLFSSVLFLKALAVIYLIAFISFGVQAKGLIGSQGILPVSTYLQQLRTFFGGPSFFRAPTIFWWNASDWFIQAICISGAIASILLLVGMLPRLVLVILFFLYLSLVTGGQTFMSFQWDVLLLETGFLAIFLTPSSRLVIFLFWWLLFRLIFFSGFVKLASGDPTWRELTALSYHHETQPLPTIFGWFTHQLPIWLNKLSTLLMFGVELLLPFLFFVPRYPRMAAGIGVVLLQIFILLTGNYTFFNLLTIALTFLLFDDQFWKAILPEAWFDQVVGQASVVAGGAALNHFVIPLVALLIGLLSILYLWVTLSPRTMTRDAQAMLSAVATFHIMNSYGLFAVMTTSRPEIIVEGSDDRQTWKAYEFKFKPGDLKRPPRWVAPHQPRLDWQMWFAALGSYRENPWFLEFVRKLLYGSKDVIALLKVNPFPDKSPKYIRAGFYDYHFTTFQERRITGEWWKRGYLGLYLPEVLLEK